MAQVRLYRRDVDDLPDVCMRCGQPSEVIRTRTFSWQPPWIAILLLAGLLPYVIVAIILTKRMRVDVPLCAAHRNHWLTRNLIVWGSLLALAALAVLGLAVSQALADPMGLNHDDALSWVCLGTVGLLVVWIIIAVVAQQTAIRPVEITDDSITLTGVSPDFRQAVRDGGWDAEEDRPGRPLKSDHFRGSKPPRRPLPPDAFREAEE